MLKELKLDESSAIDSFQQIKDEMKAAEQNREELRDNILTLENFVERYQPMQMLKVVTRFFKPLFKEDKLSHI